jgi:hypothetical protein
MTEPILHTPDGAHGDVSAAQQLKLVDVQRTSAQLTHRMPTSMAPRTRWRMLSAMSRNPGARDRT